MKLEAIEISGTGNSFFTYFFQSVFQISMPTFPVVVKIGHAHSGMGKVEHHLKWKLFLIQEGSACNINARLLVCWHGKYIRQYSIWVDSAFTLELKVKR